MIGAGCRLHWTGSDAFADDCISLIDRGRRSLSVETQGAFESTTNQPFRVNTSVMEWESGPAGASNRREDFEPFFEYTATCRVSKPEYINIFSITLLLS